MFAQKVFISEPVGLERDRLDLDKARGIQEVHLRNLYLTLLLAIIQRLLVCQCGLKIVE